MFKVNIFVISKNDDLVIQVLNYVSMKEHSNKMVTCWTPPKQFLKLVPLNIWFFKHILFLNRYGYYHTLKADNYKII